MHFLQNCVDAAATTRWPLDLLCEVEAALPGISARAGAGHIPVPPSARRRYFRRWSSTVASYVQETMPDVSRIAGWIALASSVHGGTDELQVRYVGLVSTRLGRYHDARACATSE